MIDDQQLLIDAHKAAMAALAVIEASLSNPTRNQIDNAQRHASEANAKLVEYQCRQRMQPRKVEA